jgi:ABC-type glycerol-3-phosphate transport system substrate-binding protein
VNQYIHKITKNKEKTMKRSLIALMIASATLVACGDKDTASESDTADVAVEDSGVDSGM